MPHVVLPNESMRERLGDRLGDARVSVWRLGSGEPFPGEAELLVLPYMIPPSALASLEGLPIGLVQSQTLGHDGVALHLPEGLRYCNAVEVHEDSTAELALGLIIAMQRGIVDAVRAAERESWEHRRQPGLAGKRVLLLGAGGVGSAILRRLAPFEAEVRVVARSERDGVFGMAALPELLPWADIVIVAIPLTDDTRRSVGADFLAMMGDGALLVNVSRGEVVDTAALLAEARSGRLRAALDVTDPEPLPEGHPLWRLPNLLITPHIGGDTDAMDQRVDRIVLEQLRRIRQGMPPVNLVYGVSS